MGTTPGQKAARSRRMNAKRRATIAKINKQITSLPNHVYFEMQAEIRETARAMVATAKQNAPKRTGALADSIEWDWVRNLRFKTYRFGAIREGHDLAAAVSAGNSNVRYAHIVEFGSKAAPADPFFYPAVRIHQTQLNAKMTRRAQRAARKAVR